MIKSQTCHSLISVVVVYCQQGRITYAAQGYYPADAFFTVNETSGVITLTKSLTSDPDLLQSYRVRYFRQKVPFFCVASQM